MKKLIYFFLTLLIINTNLSAKITLKTEFQDTTPKYTRYSNGLFGGLCVELIRLIEKNSDYKFDYPSEFMPTRRIQLNMEKGDTNVHLGWARNDKREKLFRFGEPLYDVSTILISRKDYRDNIESFEDLEKIRNSRILAVFGAGSNVYLKETFNLELEDSAKTPDANLEKLLLERGDFFAYHSLGLLYKVRTSPYENQFKVHPLKLRTYQHWMVFSKSTPQYIIDDLKRIIQELKKSGEWQKITDKYLKY